MAQKSLPPGLEETEMKISHVVQSLHTLIIQAINHQGSQTEDAMKREINRLVTTLHDLNASAQDLDILVPYPIIDYIQEGRNPDIYTREFVEVTMRQNQLLKGRMAAFGQFRDELARHIAVGIPELKEDVKAVVDATGGKFEG